jgi:Zn-dependent peptidase ImmA (M78 family)
MTPSAKATEILEALEIMEACPVPLQKIVDHIGYKAQLFPSSDKTKNLACGVNRDQKVIMANAGDSPEEQRYSFAHAIGHVVLEEEGNVVDKKTNLHPSIEEQKEWDANQFANELLMGNTIFLKKWDECNGDQPKVARAFCLAKDRIISRASALKLI